jgi:hypothetical protein
MIGSSSSRPRFGRFNVLLVVAALAASRGSAVGAEPADAVVAITSHGCSGTVIATGPEETWLLTCGHAFRGQDRSRPLAIDVPSPAGSPSRRPGSRPSIFKLSEEDDLCLIRLGVGPLPYFLPVAEQQPAVGARVYAVGYVRMEKPATTQTTRLVAIGEHWQNTYTKPIPGMSGGPLVDEQGGGLVGTCTGYEAGRGGRGMFVRLALIRRFLGLLGGLERSPRRVRPFTPGIPPGS